MTDDRWEMTAPAAREIKKASGICHAPQARSFVIRHR
jgi:hypothetical protein